MIKGNDPLELFAARMEKRAKNIAVKVDAALFEAFELIATDIFTKNPLWSSQSVVNWTASIGHQPAIVANIVVPMERTEDRAAGLKAGLKAISMVRGKYKRSRSGKNPSYWLTNPISYTGKLWSGAWPSNTGNTLSSAIEKGIPAIRRIRLLKF